MKRVQPHAAYQATEPEPIPSAPDFPMNHSQNSTAMQAFAFDSHAVRVVDIDGQPGLWPKTFVPAWTSSITAMQLPDWMTMKKMASGISDAIGRNKKPPSSTNRACTPSSCVRKAL